MSNIDQGDESGGFDGKTLWAVSVEIECLVVAEDEAGAIEEFERAARSYSMDEMGGALMHASPCRQVPRSWRGSVPFGDDGDRTVEQWLAGPQLTQDELDARARAEEARRKQLPLAVTP